MAQPVHTLTPYLVCKDAGAAIAFYRDAFGAEEQFRLTDPAGKIGHAELKIGSATFFIADEYPDFGALSPQAIGGTPVKLHLVVEAADAAFARAVQAGATELRPVVDQFYGERVGQVADPSGHVWFLAQPIEEVEPAEMQRRWDQVFETT